MTHGSWYPSTATAVALLFSALVLGGCSDDAANDPQCPEGALWNDALNVCYYPKDDATGADTASITDAPDSAEPDSVADLDELVDTNLPIDPACDKDFDGELAIACGGNDCDDEHYVIAPGRDEICDAYDNDCDGVVNNNIRCTVFAQTGEGLYRIDPFALTATRVTDVPELFDMDTDPLTGKLYGITASALFEFDDVRNSWFRVGSFPATIADANGMAIDSTGTAFVTSANDLYSVDLGTANSVLVGHLGGAFYSSGDCVINKSDTLFMTSKDFGVPDTLIVVDRATGAGTAVGSIGFQGVYGLTVAWGTMYGMTGAGEFIQIDRATGVGTLVHTFEGLSWFGAASAPGR